MSTPVLKSFVIVLEVTKLIGLLVSTIQSALPAQLNFRYLQQQQINALKKIGSYVLSLNMESKEELQWLFRNLKISNV